MIYTIPISDKLLALREFIPLEVTGRYCFGWTGKPHAQLTIRVILQTFYPREPRGGDRATFNIHVYTMHSTATTRKSPLGCELGPVLTENRFSVSQPEK